MDSDPIEITHVDLANYINKHKAHCKAHLNKILSANDLFIPLFSENELMLPMTLKLDLTVLHDLGKISLAEYEELQGAKAYDYEYEIHSKHPEDEVKSIKVIRADHSASASIIGNPYRNHLGQLCLRVSFSLRQLVNEPDTGTAEITIETSRYGEQSFTINYPPQGLGFALL